MNKEQKKERKEENVAVSRKNMFVRFLGESGY